MTIDPAWEDSHRKHRWGAWPNTRFVEFAMRRFGNVPNRAAVRFLELGCGGGAQVAFLAAEGFMVRGVDGSDEAIRKASQLVAHRTAAIPPDKVWAYVFPDDIAMMEYPDGLFDCVFDVATLQHLSRAEAELVISRASRWLKPDGVFWSMMANSLAPMPADTPTPLFTDDPLSLFGAKSWGAVKIGVEIVNLGDRRTSHWIIEAQPIKTAA